ncbi:MAG: hypothetical protein ACTIJH_05955 [Moraxellaceae bacterium]
MSTYSLLVERNPKISVSAIESIRLVVSVDLSNSFVDLFDLITITEDCENSDELNLKADDLKTIKELLERGVSHIEIP